MSLCLGSLIYSIPISERCSYVKTHCEENFINFYSLHFCTFNSHFFLTIPSFIFFLFIFFFLLSDTCNNFLIFGVIKIVDILKISQNLAGVTLLAFGNGASDVISSLVASSDVNGIDFSISALLGSGMFITSFVFGLVVYNGNGIRVNSNMFNRNILLYLLALGMLVFIAYGGYISFKESFCFILIYSINIFIALVQDYHLKKQKLMKSAIQEDIEVNNENSKEEKLNVNNNNIEQTINNNCNDINVSYEKNAKDETIIHEKGQNYNNINIKHVSKTKNVSFSDSCGHCLNENIQLFKLKAKKHYYTYKKK